jgi:hypothetical protein
MKAKEVRITCIFDLGYKFLHEMFILITVYWYKHLSQENIPKFVHLYSEN